MLEGIEQGRESWWHLSFHVLRVKSRDSPNCREEPSFELFRARPCPTFPSRSSTPERAEVKLTMPTSPNLSYRTRPESRSSSASRLREEPSFEFKALPVPRSVYEPMVCCLPHMRRAGLVVA
jgi:hypothetical protein